MALETSHTDSPGQTTKKATRPSKRAKSARRRPPAASTGSSETVADADRVETPARPVQLDVALVATGADAIELKPSRRVRVRKAGATPPGIPGRTENPVSTDGSTAIVAGSGEAPTKSDRSRRGHGRRPSRGRRSGAAVSAVPASPAEAMEAAELPVSLPEMREAQAGDLEFEPLDAESAIYDAAGAESFLEELPPSEVLVEDRPLDEEVTTIEPAGEGEGPESEAEDTPRRRRRGRRGRRGGRRQGQPVPGPVVPAQAASPARPQPKAAEVIEPDIDEEPTVAMDEDQDLGPELEVTAFTDRSRSKGSLGRELIINISAGFECRVAILHEGRLEELFIERESTQSHVGNIYKGRVTNVEPSIQAAFVDFGLEKNGFLHISDVQPQYFPDHKGGAEDVGRKIPRHHRPPIQKCFRRGQEVIVQITKEGVGTKGPTLTSYLSIPGRFLVMMPGMSHTGVSRKIEDEAARKRMRDILSQLVLPKGIGFILRTAGLDRPKRELQRDLNYLLRLWKTVVDRIKRQNAPAELYRESDLVIRTLRDVYSSDFSRIVVDDAGTAKKVREFLRIAMPRTKVAIELYTDREPLFHRLGIEAEIERINMRHVPLASGGSLVIDSTEAMVAIDVNSGRFRTLDDAEETALRINLEAAEEIARQLRLRDLGGLIVCDFIDMRLERNKRKVEGALREALKKHKERARILRMSAFGLIEMTRQRQGPSIRRNMYHDCPHCRGAGQVKLPESVMLDAMRMIQLAAHQEQVHKIMISLAPEVAYSLLNRKRVVLNQIESETGKKVFITGKSEFTSDQMELLCEDNRGREITVAGATASSR